MTPGVGGGRLLLNTAASGSFFSDYALTDASGNFTIEYDETIPDLEGPRRGRGGRLSMRIWNDFRYLIVEYLLLTDPDRPGGYDETIRAQRICPALLELDGRSDVLREGLRRLALRLLDRFSCVIGLLRIWPRGLSRSIAKRQSRLRRTL